jgi:hypothetical protein
MCAVAPRRMMLCMFHCRLGLYEEIHMYIGGGILGTILVLAAIIFLLRRA